MEELNVTLSLFFEIRDARLFGGVGKTGYSKSDLDLCVYNLSGFNLSAYIRDQIKVLADLCKVAPEKIRDLAKQRKRWIGHNHIGFFQQFDALT